MKNSDEKLELILGKLRHSTPVIEEAEGLTDSIMQHIGQRFKRIESHWIQWLRVVSSSAAVFLFGLFIFQQTEAGNNRTTAQQTPFIENKVTIDSTCFQTSSIDKINLRETYYCYVQQRSNKKSLLQSYAQRLTN